MNMSRVIFSINQCSPVEQRLLRALRAMNWNDNWPAQAGFFLEEMGFGSSQVFAFNSLIETIMQADPGFDLLGPLSPFVSRDELNLLAALGNASRKASNALPDVEDGLPAVLKSLVDTCGTALRRAGLPMKTRATLQNGKALPPMTSKILPFQGESSMRRVKVLALHAPTPRVRRIVLGGYSLKSFAVDLPAQWIKVFLPGPTEQQIGRAFTIRDFDTVKKELTFDIALHEGGPMSDWALRAQVGDELQIAGPRGGFKGVDEKSWLLLACDDTGLPAIAAIVCQLPAHLQVQVFIEVADETERQFLAVQPRVKVRWIYRNGSADQPAETLAEVLRYSPLPVRSGDAWIAAEASTIRAIRTQLLRDRGFELGRVHAAGYWKRGEQDHRDLAAG